MNANKMTVAEFRALPMEPIEGSEMVEFQALILLPRVVRRWRLAWHRLKRLLASKIGWIRTPEDYEVPGLHDSGYRCMDFVLEGEGGSLRRISAWSDIVHIDGIGGYGWDWLNRCHGVPDSVPVTSWSLDCLAVSGLLRLFPHGTMMTRGWALSSFEVYAKREEPLREAPRNPTKEGEDA